MKKYNYHTHTYRCGHAQKGITDEDLVKEYIKNDFDVIAFTDHCPQKDPVDTREKMRMKYSQKDEYLDSIKCLKEKYKDKIEIETGYEVEYLPGEEDNLTELKNETDKIVLGQHLVYDDNKDCPDRQFFSPNANIALSTKNGVAKGLVVMIAKDSKTGDFFNVKDSSIANPAAAWIASNETFLKGLKNLDMMNYLIIMNLI